MAADPYVILPLRRFQQLQKRLTEPSQQKAPIESTQSTFEAAKAASDPGIPDTRPIKAYKKGQVAHFRQECEKHNIQFSNLDKLIAQALGTGKKKKIENQDLFYAQLFQAGLESLISNNFILDQYADLYYKLN